MFSGFNKTDFKIRGVKCENNRTDSESITVSVSSLTPHILIIKSFFLSGAANIATLEPPYSNVACAAVSQASAIFLG